MKKRFLSMLLALCMVITLLPVTAWAGTTLTELYVGGATVTLPGNGATTYSNASTSDSTWWVSNSAGFYTLTLNGANLYGDTCNANGAAISATGNLSIELIGNNKAFGANFGGNSYGIYATGDVSFSGDGALSAAGCEAAGQSVGIYSSGSGITFLGAQITAEGGSAPTSYGIAATNFINVVNGTVIAKSTSSSGTAQAVSLRPMSGSGYTITASKYAGGTPTETYNSDSFGTYKYLKFVLPPSAPTASTADASNISSTAATLNGTVNANNASTTVMFEYGTSTSYGSLLSATPSIVTGTSATSVSFALTGLMPNTTYHYRVKAVNTAGMTYSEDKTFTTSGPASKPTAWSSDAGYISSTAATLYGTVNANNASTTVTFEYGYSTNYSSTATATPNPVPGTIDTSVSYALTGLTPNTTYHYRVKAVNSVGTTYGADKTFATLGSVATATSSDASNISSTAATLNGTVNANNTATTVMFEYGMTTSYGSTAYATPSSVTGTIDTSVSYALTGLQPNTIYHYRVRTVNSAGPTYGADKTFATSAAAPTATSSDASSISSSAATLNGTVNANSAPTTVTFEYGTGTSYGSTATAIQSPVAGRSATSVSYALTGLTPNTTYHYRVKAVNTAGTTYGEDKTFTTSVAAPTATSSDASSISSTAATLNGTANANSASTTVTFEYGTGTSYGSTATAIQSPVTGTSVTSVSYALTGLTPNTTYHYRVKAVNTTGTTYGADKTFTTPAVVPTATSAAAISISSTAATLKATVNANNAASIVTFEYGMSTSYGSTATAAQSIVTGTSATPVSSALTGLTPNTTYHYRVKAVNTAGTTYGADTTFTTSANQYNVTLSGIGLTCTNTGNNQATQLVAWSGILSVNTGYLLPPNISMTIGGTSYAGFSYSRSTGAVSVPSAAVTGAIVITANGVTSYIYNTPLPQTVNGVTATVSYSSASPQAANTAITATVTLIGTATAAGDHQIKLSSTTAGLNVAAQPASVTAGQILTLAPVTKTFTFTVPTANVTDLTLTNTFLSRNAMPTVVFTATGQDDGTLGGVTTAMKYSVDGGTSWQSISGTTMSITGVTTTNGIRVYQPGNGTTTVDSAAQTITVTKAATPTTAGKTDCTTAANNNGKLTGVTGVMEYKLSTAAGWMNGTGSDITGLAAGTYLVRVKATGTVLSSDSQSITITAYSTPPSGGNGGNDSGSTYTPPAPITEIKNGGSTTGSNLDQLISGRKTLTVDGDKGAKLVFNADALKGIDGQTSGEIKVEMKDVSPTHQENLPGKLVFSLTVSSGSNTISNFGGSVTVSLPYELKEGETADKVAVWYLANDGTMTEIPCTYDPAMKLATFTVTHFSLYVVGVPGVKPWVNPFTDVSKSDWFYSAVEFANQNGLFAGTGAANFSPNSPMTRAMLWTVLGRLNGQKLSGSGVFDAARSWAMGAGITDGTNPDGSITREQMVTILWRYAGSPKAGGDLSKFSDVGSVASYAADAMAWALENGIVTGTNGALMPRDNATRAQVAAILQRFVKEAAK